MQPDHQQPGKSGGFWDLPEKELGQAPFVAAHGPQCSKGARFCAYLAKGYLQYNWREIRLNAITSIFTVLLLTGLCYLVIRRQVKKMLEGSIVESIREE